MPVISALYATREQTMEEPLRVAAIECLSEQGFDVPAEARNLEEMSGDPTEDEGAQRNIAAQCIGERALELYPELPYVPQGY